MRLRTMRTCTSIYSARFPQQTSRRRRTLAKIGRIIITIERDVPETGSGCPDLGHDAYYIKKWVEKDAELKGKPRVVNIEIEQEFNGP